jgi:pantothenate synthetase
MQMNVITRMIRSLNVIILLQSAEIVRLNNQLSIERAARKLERLEFSQVGGFC